MKKITYATLALLFAIEFSNAQSNYLDNYISNPVTLTTVGTSSNQINQPQDLDFKPNSNELWVCNYGTSSGGSVVIFYDAGSINQSSQYRKDTHSGHFMIYPSSMAFGDNGMWAAVSEIQSTGSPTSTFMGPALWSSDTSITARVFQNNWVNGYPLGSHLDMLHQSPFAMGIAHDSAMIYWVMDGHNGNICKYDFVQHHGPGYDNHSAGKIWRYIDVTVSRVPQVPSHMVLDKQSGWLYFIDGGTKKIKRLNTNTGAVTGTLTVPSSSQEPLSGYWKVESAIVEELDTLATQPCGIDYYNGRLIVSDYTTGDIYLYNTVGTFSLLGTVVTGHPGMMGIKIGPDGHIWCVNKTESKVYRLEAGLPIVDAAITSIASPEVENYLSNYYSTAFNVCDGNINPIVQILNTGNTTINDLEIQYLIDGTQQATYNWSGSLTTGNTVSVSLPGTAVLNGSHQIDIIIMMVNGMADDVDLNNVMTGAFRVVNPPAILPLSEGFSAPNFPPAGWNYVNFNPNNKMSRVTTGGFGASTGSMKMDNYSGPMDITGQKDYLMSPIIDFTLASVNTYLRFNVAYAKYNTASNDGFQVAASTDCGISWTTVYNKLGTALSTAPNTTGVFTPTASQWRTDSVNISSYAGQSEVMLMFTAISNYGNNLYVDDIYVGDISTGISEFFTEKTISIFPNPVSSTLNLSLSEKLNHSATVAIYSQDGRVVKTFSITPDQSLLQIDITNLTSGLYALNLIGENISFSKVFVKQ